MGENQRKSPSNSKDLITQGINYVPKAPTYVFASSQLYYIQLWFSVCKNFVSKQYALHKKFSMFF